MFFFFKRNPYIAIIGDIKQSRSLSNRNEIQKRLKAILDCINKTYANDISASFTITLGDEFQGLLESGANVMRIITEIERCMYPVKIRFGIGIGEITTDIVREMAIGADGPGYHKARAALEYLKENERKNQTGRSDIRLEVDSENQASSSMINTILSLITVIKDTWTNRQREIIWDMLEHQDAQMNVAKRLGIKQPAVQKSLASGNYYEYKAALDTIGIALDEIRR